MGSRMAVRQERRCWWQSRRKDALEAAHRDLGHRRNSARCCLLRVDKRFRDLRHGGRTASTYLPLTSSTRTQQRERA